MIKTIIVEDELNVREGLKKMLKILEPSIQIIGETSYANDAITLINNLKPNLVFMDIELEDGTGFDVLNNITSLNFNVIFTTAYNQYAIKAFKYSAIDYLLKPIDPLDLKNAIERVKQKVDYDNVHKSLLQTLKNNLTNNEKQIVLKTTEQRYIIATSNIIRLEANGAYTHFVTTDKKIIVSKNIKFYEEILDTDFIRCHQSHLINKKHLKGLKKTDVIMSNGDIVPVSIRKKMMISKLIK